MENFISNLLKAEAFAHSVDEISFLETHISWVILTGQFAYKIKKPVNFGFLDFSTLEKRRRYCEAELRLNKSLAPELYLGVVPITSSEKGLKIDGEGDIIDYAVKMREFPQNQQLDLVLAAGKLELKHMHLLASRVANFHQNAEPVKNSDYGDPETIYAAAKDNFSQIIDHLNPVSRQDLLNNRMRPDIAHLAAWTRQSYFDLKSTFLSRKEDGFIRACHGDMHLRNMVLIDGDIVIFDCIEFNDSLRCIDVMSEIAFVVMDLQYRGLEGFAMYFLNRYLAITGDYSGLRVFNFYLVYRAVVRAKVAILQAVQLQDATTLLAECSAYMALAKNFTRQRSAKLLITHGVSGSGKSTFTDGVLQYLPAIRLRSDVERKRCYGVDALLQTRSDLDDGMYRVEATEKTYAQLRSLAEAILKAGWNVIVDATFLKHSQRQLFFLLSQELGAELIILSFSAPKPILQQRIIERNRSGNDASEANLAVLEQQLASQQELNAQELTYCIDITDNSAQSAKMVSEKLNAQSKTLKT